ncbi:MAG: hypothetical protein FWD61_09485 [Phycisphaerales bacterium]|nr:hypothetical protein [Phycisphaerales bacterium]
MARRFPRDVTNATTRIVQACQRKSLAERAVYSYPRGDTTVEGPSIRLAEAMAQSWGNLDFGIIELEQRNGESNVMAYCWDLETNTRQTKIFSVPHKRHTRKGSYPLTDPRDIYEMVANQGARRLRACILGVIPGDIVDKALEQCNATLRGGDKKPLIDRVQGMVLAFSEMGVTQQQIEKRLGHRIEITTESELVQLRKVFASIRDNMAPRESYFDLSDGVPTADDPSKSRGDNLADKLKTKDSPKSGRPGPKAEKKEEAQSSGENRIPTDDEAHALADEYTLNVPLVQLQENLGVASELSPDELKAAMKMADVSNAASASEEDIRSVAYHLHYARLKSGKIPFKSE